MCDLVIRSVADLTPGEWSAWREIRAAAPSLESPFFAPEWIRTMAADRPVCRVAVLRRGTEIVGFFPFESNSLGLGRPIGGRLSDYHGPLLRPDAGIDPLELIRRCGLVSYAFAHVPAGLTGFERFAERTLPSHCLDVTGGFDTYRQLRKSQGSNGSEDLRRAEKKIAGQLESYRYTWHTEDAAVFDTLLRWKRERYAATGFSDVLAHEWVRASLQRIAHTKTDDFSGVVSALWLGDELIAAHFCVRSGTVLHSWFPAFDSTCEKLSPGNALLKFMIDEAPRHGISRIDLGAGDEPYKTRLATGGVPLLAGHVDTDSALSAARDAVRGARRWLRESPFERVTAGPVRAFRLLREQWSMR